MDKAQITAYLNSLSAQIAAVFDLDLQSVEAIVNESCEDQLGLTPSKSAAVVVSPSAAPKVTAAVAVPFPTIAEIEAMFGAPAKGGLKVVELKERAAQLGLEGVAKLTKPQLKELFISRAATAAPVDEKQCEHVYTKGPNEGQQCTTHPKAGEVLCSKHKAHTKNHMTDEDITKMFAVPSKGGLTMSELRTKAKELGIDLKGITKKADIEAAFRAHAAEDEAESCAHIFAKGPHKGEQCAVHPEDGGVVCGKHKAASKKSNSASDEDSASVTVEEVEAMFAPPAKGGLKMAELKTKAAELGIEGLTKKSELKEAMLEIAEDAVIHIEQDESASEAETATECSFIFTKGPRKGEKCTTKPKNGEALCGKHKGCKGAQDSATVTEASEQSEPAEEASTGEHCIYVPTRGQHKGEACPNKPTEPGAQFCSKHADTQQAKAHLEASGEASQDKAVGCMYIGERGPNKGAACSNKPKPGENFCSKHANTQQAINYRANESPIARAAAQKAVESDSESSKPKITRNKEHKLWVVDGGNLVVKSPKNPTVYAYITKSGEVKNKVTETVKQMAEELGLAVE